MHPIDTIVPVRHNITHSDNISASLTLMAFKIEKTWEGLI